MKPHSPFVLLMKRNAKLSLDCPLSLSSFLSLSALRYAKQIMMQHSLRDSGAVSKQISKSRKKVNSHNRRRALEPAVHLSVREAVGGVHPISIHIVFLLIRKSPGSDSLLRVWFQIFLTTATLFHHISCRISVDFCRYLECWPLNWSFHSPFLSLSNLNMTKPYMHFSEYCRDYGEIRGPERSSILDLNEAPQEKQT